MLKCPYDGCKSKEIESIKYIERYDNDRLTCLTYECRCRKCGRLFTHSKNLEVE
jgi:hypothetical protein